VSGGGQLRDAPDRGGARAAALVLSLEGGQPALADLPASVKDRPKWSRFQDGIIVPLRHRYGPLAASDIFSIAWSMVKVFGFCTAGKSLNVVRNLPVMACAA
jgi:hypothetical protein